MGALISLLDSVMGFLSPYLPGTRQAKYATTADASQVSKTRSKTKLHLKCRNNDPSNKTFYYQNNMDKVKGEEIVVVSVILVYF